jgi:hypothetical protein
MLCRNLTRDFAAQGREITRWMSSHLNEHAEGKTLVTAYIARDNGIERQYLDVRKSVRGVKTVIAGCFNVDRADDLARPIFWLSMMRQGPSKEAHDCYMGKYV